MTDQSAGIDDTGDLSWLADILLNCVSAEICTVDYATKQHIRHHLTDEQRALLAVAVNTLKHPSYATPAESGSPQCHPVKMPEYRYQKDDGGSYSATFDDRSYAERADSATNFDPDDQFTKDNGL